MKPLIYIDPEIDLLTREFVRVIIEFRVSPAHAAMAGDPSLSLEQARKQVEQSHKEFQDELDVLLAENHCPYTIMHHYKNSLNGIAIELQGIAIQMLLSSQVIRTITPNREMKVPEIPIM